MAGDVSSETVARFCRDSSERMYVDVLSVLRVCRNSIPRYTLHSAYRSAAARHRTVAGTSTCADSAERAHVALPTKILPKCTRSKPCRATGSLGRDSHVQIEPALNGKPGNSHVLFDPRGIRRPDVPGNPTDWQLTFQKHHPRMQVISDTAWEPTGDHADVRFDSNGDLLFSKAFGADRKSV